MCVLKRRCAKVCFRPFWTVTVFYHKGVLLPPTLMQAQVLCVYDMLPKSTLSDHLLHIYKPIPMTAS